MDRQLVYGGGIERGEGTGSCGVVACAPHSRGERAVFVKGGGKSGELSGRVTVERFRRVSF